MIENEQLMLNKLSELARSNSTIDSSLYEKYNVQRGLRDLNGKGVLAGLTEISEITGSMQTADGKVEACPGILKYRGIDINDFVNGCLKDNRFGFEEVAYLLLFGKLPSKQDLDSFTDLLSSYRKLPVSFTRDIILKAPSKNLINMLQRGILTLYSYDENADDISSPNVLKQCLQLISQLPMIAVYSYHAYRHYHGAESLIIHTASPELSIAETILYLLRHDKNYTELEAKILDLCLILHAEHGGGNNSTFTTHVVTSSGSDTYSTTTASLSSLKGPRHGGANIKVVEMMENLQNTLSDFSDDSIKDYLSKLLDKQGFDNSGLIYGMGHAVYSMSDPRTVILKESLKKLSMEQHHEKEFEIYEKVERLAPIVIAEKRKIYKGVCVNVDFYSGLVYKLLNIPTELYTPLFAISRMVGWSAHRMEELANNGKIIRPSYRCVAPDSDYIELNKR